MKCKEAQKIIASLGGDELPEDLQHHVEGCAACAEILRLEVRMRAALKTPPVDSMRGFERVAASITENGKARRSWFELLKGTRPIMKYTATALAACLAIAAFVAIPGHATAAQPLATFAKMKKAILAKSKSKSKLKTDLGIKVGKKPDGSIGTWVIVNDELVEVLPGTSYNATIQNGNLTVKTSSNLDALTPEMKKKVEEMIQQAEATGTTNVKVMATVNGKPVDPDEIQPILKQAGINFGIQIDLDEDHYQKIAFGGNEHTLVLTPKATANRRLVVQLDPSSSVPNKVQVEQNKGGHWIPVKKSGIALG